MTSIDPALAFAGAAWFDVIPRHIACPQLRATVLLHAGPPYLGPPPAPVHNSAVQALLFEGLATNEAEANELLSSGAVRLEPAQNHGVATPLAQVVSASMWLVAVRYHAHVSFAAMLEGAPPALRFGCKDFSCRHRLRELGRLVIEHVRPVLRAAPMPLAEIIREAVAAGDDCHSRTGAANHAVVRGLVGLDAATSATLTSMPAFALPILMAAAATALQHHGSSIQALGGNGVDFGVRRRGAAEWDRRAALAPAGPRLAGREDHAALPAIGDSVLIDFCGLGGHVDHPALRDTLRDPKTGILDPARIENAPPDELPSFNLAMIDADGTAGLLGRGTYRPPAELFHVPT